MIRLVLFLLVVLAVVVGLHWLADRPGTITVEWQGYIAETSVFRALVILAAASALLLCAWSLLRQVWRSPATMGRYLYRRRQKRGLDALSGGIIAIGAGDRALALRYAGQARKALPHEPLTHLLRAQAAQLGGDRATARRIFEAMLASPDTEQLGLRGLFLEARARGRARGRAPVRRARAAEAIPSSTGRSRRCSTCSAAPATGRARSTRWRSRAANNLIDKAPANRRRAVLLTAQAQAAGG